MKTAITIDTLDALQAAHKLYDRAHSLTPTNEDKAKEISRVADAGFSALIPYIKNRTAPVMKKHYDAMQRMIDYAKELE